MTSDQTAANSAAKQYNSRSRRTLALSLLLCAVVLLSSVFGALYVGASGSSGIKNNGLEGITIDIYSSTYKTLAKQSSGAYGRGGCAWFASSRASELTGRNLGVHSPSNWWSSYAESFGFRKSSTPVSKGFAIFSNHMVVIERVNGDTLTISEGSNPSASDASHCYCVIRNVNRSTFENGNYKGQSFRGYIDLGVRSDNPPTADTASYDNGGLYVARGKVDQKWHAYRGDVPALSYTGIAWNPLGWWRVVNGNVDFNANGVYQNELGWWKLANGKVDFSYSGLASNSHGTWYIVKGKVDFSYNGELDWNGSTWTITNGKATLQ